MARGSPCIRSRAEPAPPRVRVASLEAGYGKGRKRVAALRSVNLRAVPGSVTALVGPNGAGKTTLFRILLGFLVPWAGSVNVGGLAPSAYRRSRGVAYLPEAIQAPGGWTVRELFREGARLAGLTPGERRPAVARALRSSGLDAGAAERPLAGLSRGMFRRAQLAYALLGDPGLILLDEPWSGLDPPARAHLRTGIRELAGAGGTVILASHELDEVQRTADRAVLLHQGRIVQVVEGPAQLPVGTLEGILLGRGQG